MANKTHSTKRIQVSKAKSFLLAVVAGASVITVFSLMASKAYFSEVNYLNRVGTEKEKALNQLKENKEAAVKLSESYKTFAAANPNALGVDPNSDTALGGENARLVLDALPSKYDFPALTASLEKLFAGYTINSITGSDDIVSQEQSDGTSAPVDMPFTANVSGDYKSIQTLITTFERSIRPFEIQILDLSAANAAIAAEIDAKTFYQPEKTLENGTKEVK